MSRGMVCYGGPLNGKILHLGSPSTLNFRLNEQHGRYGPAKWCSSVFGGARMMILCGMEEATALRWVEHKGE